MFHFIGQIGLYSSDQAFYGHFLCPSFNVSLYLNLLQGIMCYLPLPCLKGFVGLGAMISIAISLGMLAVTVYVNVEKKDIINNTSGRAITDALVVLYLASAVFMVLGICGLYGAIKARKRRKGSGNCLLGLYFIGVMFFLLLFLAGGIFFFIGPEAIFGTDCKSGSKTDLVKEMYQLNIEANNTFCSEDCPCYISPANADSDLANWLAANNYTYNSVQQSNRNYQACNPDDGETPNILLFAALEELLKCSGWCEGEEARFLKFSDINQCVDQQCLDERGNCHHEFQTFLTSKGRLIGYGCFIAMAVCLLNVITVCCICFHPSKTKKGNNFYARMMEDD